MANSTAKHSACKPSKPYDDFPLFSHANGKWAKKIRGKLYYFGKWDNPQGAIEDYLERRDELHSGRTPKPDGALTVKSLGDRYLTAREHDVEAGEITRRTWSDYYSVAQVIADVVGKDRLVDDLGADDFAKLKRHVSQTWGPVRVGNFIQRARTIFKWAYDSYLIEKPVRFGPGFKRPSQRVLRKHRAANGERTFEPQELRTIIGAANKHLKAMVLLALNGGFGNADCARLPISAVDMEGGWVTFPRPKTGVKRRFPLWPETIEAIRAVEAMGRKPKDPKNAGHIFITERGFLFVKEKPTCPISQAFSKLLKRIDNKAAKEAEKAGKEPPPPLSRRGHSFYTLRHVFQTEAENAGESPDFAAISRIMGHAEKADDMSARYRERISDERLRRITDHVRNWLFPPEEEPKEATEEAAGEGGVQ